MENETTNISSSNNATTALTEVMLMGHNLNSGNTKLKLNVWEKLKMSASLDTTKTSNELSHQIALDQHAQTPTTSLYQVVVSPSSFKPKTSSSVVSNSTLQVSSQKGQKRPSVSSLSLPPYSIKTPAISKSSSLSDMADAFISPSEHLLSQIPLMNSMVRYKLQQLLRERAARVKNRLEELEMRNRPVAVLTAYSVRKVPFNKTSNGSQSIEANDKKPGVNKHRLKVFYDNFMPIDCGHLSAIIHLDKFYCPGTYRPCVEFEGGLISPIDLLEKAGIPFNANWKSIFKTSDSRPVKWQFDHGKLDFKNHDMFCTGACKFQMSGQPLSLKNIFSDISETVGSQRWMNQNKKRKIMESQRLQNVGVLQQVT